MSFEIEAVEYELGEHQLDLSKIIPDFDKTFDKTGISKVFYTERMTHEMGVVAAEKAFKSSGRSKESIKFLLYVTQSPSRILPGDSVLVHRELGLPPNVAIFDINAGCSGFVQALFMAIKMVETLGPGIVVCSDAYRRKLDPNDRSTNAVFSDAGSAVIIGPDGHFDLVGQSFQVESSKGPEFLTQNHNHGYLKMNGPALWQYTRGSVVNQINELIKSGISMGFETNRLYIHQASKLVVEGISSKVSPKTISIPQNFNKFGNSVSSTLPILIKGDLEEMSYGTTLLAGFGVGIISACLLIAGKK